MRNGKVEIIDPNTFSKNVAFISGLVGLWQLTKHFRTHLCFLYQLCNINEIVFLGMYHLKNRLLFKFLFSSSFYSVKIKHSKQKIREKGFA